MKKIYKLFWINYTAETYTHSCIVCLTLLVTDIGHECYCVCQSSIDVAASSRRPQVRRCNRQHI